MKPFRHIITLVCLAAAFIDNAGEQPTVKAKGTAKESTSVELQPLQGIWEGAVVGDESHKQITVTVTGNSFHFHRDTNFWFQTTITLPAGTNPQQLHATIKDSAPPTNAVGSVVGAIFKIENETLTLVTRGGGADELPKSFEPTEDKGVTRYEFRKIQRQKPKVQSPQSK